MINIIKILDCYGVVGRTNIATKQFSVLLCNKKPALHVNELSRVNDTEIQRIST